MLQNRFVFQVNNDDLTISIIVTIGKKILIILYMYCFDKL